MLLLVLTTLALATPEDQVLTNAKGARLRWASMPIPFVADPANSAGLDEDGTVAAIVAGAGAWMWVEDSEVEYRFRGVNSGLEGGYDGENVVFFTDKWVATEDLLALTSTWSDADGTILDFDLVINTRDHQWSLDGAVGGDLQNALAHEFGHALGFGHDEQDEEATMFPSATSGETHKRDLGASDIAVARWLYPALDAEEVDTPETRALQSCSSAPAASLFAFIPAALLAVRRRKEIS